jgi:hypothetical protein
MLSPVWNTVYTLDVGEVCCDSGSVKTSAALGSRICCRSRTRSWSFRSPRKRVPLRWPEAEEV